MMKKRKVSFSVMIIIFHFTIVIFLMGISSSVIFADTLARSNGNIEGTVTISAGFGIVDSVGVTALNADSSYTTVPDSTGFYQFDRPVGIYSVTAILENYEDSTITEVEVLENQTTSDIDFCLNPILGYVQANIKPTLCK
ncbi:MAG: carboxypeptidase-like regulatory domain-containing protein [Candidatus Cloacimonadota bacterium]|nr:carboxypeptidase-like regulatory domain-containing protein [Candidatus Cloacimonadota bacterium]